MLNLRTRGEKLLSGRLKKVTGRDFIECRGNYKDSSLRRRGGELSCKAEQLSPRGRTRELHDKKKFVAVKVATEKNLADDLTKPLDSKTRKRLDEEAEIIQTQILGSFRGHVSSE